MPFVLLTGGAIYIHEESAAIYLATPRTGSHAVARALCQHAGFIRLGDHHSGPRASRTPIKGYSIAYAVRCHFDALVSWYCKADKARARVLLGEADMPFGVDWLRDQIMGRQEGRFLKRHRLYDLFDPWEPEHVLRYETLERDLNNWLAFVGLDPVELERVNASRPVERRPWQTWYDGPTRHWVEDEYGEEMSALGYRWVDLPEDPAVHDR